MASTGDDNILKTDDKDLEYRKIQLKKLQDEVVDLEDIREGVSITDLGLNAINALVKADKTPIGWAVLGKPTIALESPKYGASSPRSHDTDTAAVATNNNNNLIFFIC
mgnify:CR=1 FL=1